MTNIEFNNIEVYGLAILAIVFVYYLITWAFFGKDPKPQPLSSEYSPPDGLSPGTMRYLHNMYLDYQVITALIIDLTIKQFLSLNETKTGDFVLTKTDKYSANPAVTARNKTLFEDEKYFINRIFKHGQSELHIKMNNRLQLNKMLHDMSSYYSEKYNKTHFKHNYYFLLIPFILTLYYVFMIADELVIGMYISIALASFGTACYALFYGGFIQEWKMITSKGIKPRHNTYSLVRITNFVLLFIFLVVLFGLGSYEFGVMPTSIVFTLILLNVLFTRLIKVRTKLGEIAENKILGFKNFLETVEEDRYQNEINNDLPLSYKKYENYLPYAIALDISPLWADRFHNEFRKLTMAEDMAYSRDLGYWGDSGNSILQNNASPTMTDLGNFVKNEPSRFFRKMRE